MASNGRTRSAALRGQRLPGVPRGRPTARTTVRAPGRTPTGTGSSACTTCCCGSRRTRRWAWTRPPAAALTGGFQWAFWACGLIGLSAVPVTFLLIRRTADPLPAADDRGV